MIRRLLFWITACLPGRIISEGDRPYLERYYLFTMFGKRAYLHRFVGSDPDRGVHDHPWRWAFSIVLAGWYLEERRYGTTRVRWFNWLTADTFHRVLLPQRDCGCPKDVWTLFVHSVGDVKPWGFLRGPVPGGRQTFIPHSYPGGKKHENWWRHAPRGRDLGRAPFSFVAPASDIHG